MTISRRDFVQRAGAAAALSTLTPAPGTLTPSTAPSTQNPELWIDGLSATRLGPEGLAEIAKSGLTVMETTLGPAGNPTFTYEAAVQDLATWHGDFARYPDKLIHLRRSDDILRAKREGKLARPARIPERDPSQPRRPERRLLLQPRHPADPAHLQRAECAGRGLHRAERRGPQ